MWYPKLLYGKLFIYCSKLYVKKIFWIRIRNTGVSYHIENIGEKRTSFPLNNLTFWLFVNHCRKQNKKLFQKSPPTVFYTGYSYIRVHRYSVMLRRGGGRGASRVGQNCLIFSQNIYVYFGENVTKNVSFSLWSSLWRNIRGNMFVPALIASREALLWEIMAAFSTITAQGCGIQTTTWHVTQCWAG